MQENGVTKVTKAALKGLLLLAFMIGTHSFGWVPRVSGGVVAGAGMGLLGYRKGSLSSSGAASCVTPLPCLSKESSRNSELESPSVFYLLRFWRWSQVT